MPVVKKHPEEIKMSLRLGHCLRVARDLKKLTQRRLGDAINVSYQQIGRYEIGENDLSVFRYWRLAAVLDIDPCRTATIAFSDTDKSFFGEKMAAGPSTEDELLSIYRNLQNDERRKEVRDFALAVYRSR